MAPAFTSAPVDGLPIHEMLFGLVIRDMVLYAVVHNMVHVLHMPVSKVIHKMALNDVWIEHEAMLIEKMQIQVNIMQHKEPTQ